MYPHSAFRIPHSPFGLLHDRLRTPRVRFDLLAIKIRELDALQDHVARSARLALEHDGAKAPRAAHPAHVADAGHVDVDGAGLYVVREQERGLLAVLLEDRPLSGGLELHDFGIVTER